MRLHRRLPISLLLTATSSAALLAASVDAATARKARADPVVVRGKFHRLGSGYAGLLADGKYVFLVDRASKTATQGGTLINDLTHQRRTITPSTGCAFPVIGGPWLLFANCGNQLELLSLSGGTSRTVSRPAGYAPVGVGPYWLEWENNCDQVHSCASWTFQNIHTAALRPDPTTAHRLPDLNSPSLGKSVCSPLTVPSNPLIPPTERLAFDGEFAIAHPNDRLLERCGTRKRIQIDASGADGQISTSSNAVVWISGPKLKGRFLPSLRQFTIQPTPRFLAQVALGPKTLFVLDQGGRVWTAAAPHQR